MTKKTKLVTCSWCGREFQTNVRDSHKNHYCSCECRKAVKAAQAKEYRVAKHPDSYVEHTTIKERAKRIKHQFDKNIWTRDYAERQKQRTLEMIGKIQT